MTTFLAQPASAAAAAPAEVFDFSGAFNTWLAPVIAENAWLFQVLTGVAAALAILAIANLIRSFVSKNSAKRWSKFFCTLALALAFLAPHVVIPLTLSLLDLLINGGWAMWSSATGGH